MNVSLDCIIFGLQRFGGISNYWERVLEFMRESHVNRQLILPKQVLFSGYAAAEDATPSRIETLPAKVSRYLPVRARADTVFHTSYYRRPSSRVGKYVVTVYDFIYERYRSGLARQVHTRQKLASVRSADAVICISHCTREDVLQFCPTVDPANVHVVHLGVDFDTYYPEPAANEAMEDSIVLFVGQRGGYKRFDLAIEAVRQCPGMTLGIVGPGLTSQEQALLRARLGTRWSALGPVSSAQLRRLYSQAFAFIFPSDYEGFGLPVLEAMACGCPVVAAATASLPEVGGTAAMYAQEQRPEDFAQALTALQSTERRAGLIEAGLAHCRPFSWARTGTQTLAVYAGHPPRNEAR